MDYLNGECEIINCAIEMIKFRDCEHGMVVYDVRWPSEWVEYLGFLNDCELEKECQVYLRSG